VAIERLKESTGRFVCETEPEGFLTEGMSSSESVLSTWTEARGTSMHGEMSRVLLDKSSTISEAVGRFVGVMHQHDLSNVSLKKAS
jgi:hypothetical protein